MVNVKDNLTSQHEIFTDEEEDQELLDQVENERNQMKKQTIEIMSETKIKDMGLLFGLADDEVQKIAE